MHFFYMPGFDCNSLYLREKFKKGCKVFKDGVFFDFALIVVFFGKLSFYRKFIKRGLIGHKHLLIAAHFSAFFKQAVFADVFHIQQQNPRIQIIVLENVSEKPFAVSVGDTCNIKISHIYIV